MSKNLKIKIYKSKICPVGLYGCKSLPVALREEDRMKLSEERVLRKFLE
jgi:hypothetical protein